jgi:hypothetical protein
MKRRAQILRGIEDGDWIRMKLKTLSPGNEFKATPNSQVFVVTQKVTEGAVIYATGADGVLTFFRSDASVLVQWTRG